MKASNGTTLRTIAEPAATSLEARIARLEAERAIRETIAHYARCVDARDGEGAASIFTEDGQLCGPGAPAVQGRNRIARLYGKLLGRMTSSTHLVGNEQVLFTSENSAMLHCALLAWEGFGEALDTGDANRFSLGRYELDMVREDDGEWRARTMTVVFAGQTGSPRYAEHVDRPWPPYSEAGAPAGGPQESAPAPAGGSKDSAPSPAGGSKDSDGPQESASNAPRSSTNEWLKM